MKLLRRKYCSVSFSDRKNIFLFPTKFLSARPGVFILNEL